MARREIDIDSKSPIWAQRINNLLEEKNMTQKELSEKSGVAASTLSGWMSSEEKVKRNEPKVKGLQDVAIALGTTMDYLMGGHECSTLSRQAIHQVTGLSDKAIENISKLKYRRNEKNLAKLKIINFLLENAMGSSLLDNMYYYLFGDFYFRNKENNNKNGAEMILSVEPSGVEKSVLACRELLSEGYFVSVQHELMRSKDRILEQADEVEKKQYLKWEQENKDEMMHELNKCYVENDQLEAERVEEENEK